MKIFIFLFSCLIFSNAYSEQKILHFNSAREALNFFKNNHKKVLTFIGYSSAEYENENAMLDIAQKILLQEDPKHTLISIGATPEGIGKVYSLAKEMNFETIGIVSSQAENDQVKTSPLSDTVVYIKDNLWGGYLPNTQILSPTSDVVVNLSDKIIVIGGGGVGRDEMLYSYKIKKDIIFFPADLNHKISKSKNPQSNDYSGDAYKEHKKYFRLND
ncbi:hypothetical protein [Fluviispira multicolorata]|uniref:Uncharacterized protein n=1 Tax=Fluviispira multicolorata TaxID=2654512 RepID=A0A833JF37_9BACT|nr:hypothetical protein [Fluviispira multicolorata]KAB8033529.1 hypothetical protein GCL57_02150 [Fluviispira multicolorata]